MSVQPLRRILALQSLLAAALPFAIVLGLALLWIPPQIKNEVQVRQLELAQAVGMQVEAHFETAASLVRAAAALQRADQSDLDALLGTTTIMQSLYEVAPDGEILAVALNEAERAHLADLQNLNMSGNLLFQRVSSSREPRWSETFLSVINGGLAVAYAAPGKNKFVIGEVDLGRLTRFLAQISSAQQNLLLIIDHSGQIVADNRKIYTAQQLNISNLPLVNEGIANDSPATGPFYFAGKAMTASIIQIPHVDWHILVAQTDASLYRTAHETALFGVSGLLIALGCALSVSFYQARSLASRFTTLNQHAKKVAESGSSGEWPSSSVVEFNQLSENLQEMARRLKDSETLYRTLFEQHPDGVILWDAVTLKPLRFNTTACTLSGYTAEELSQLKVTDLDNQLGQTDMLDLDEKLVRNGCASFESVHTTKTGEHRAMFVSLQKIELDGHPMVLDIHRDMTELKRVEAERQQMEMQILHTQKLESLGVLAGGIAHDFNNILMAIIGNAELAKRRLKRESPALDNLQRIEQSASRAADLAKQMLAYSGKGKFVVEMIDVNSLLEEMLHMLEVSISKKAVLRFNLQRPLPTVEADSTQMRQIVMNLVINASEAIGDTSGVIAITTGCMDCNDSYLKNVWLDENLTKGLYVFVEIADTGCGMDKETLNKLFDPFFTTKFTGRGLGMSAVLGIVRGHKGAIKVYSEPGRGTTFKILLPASNRPVELFNGDEADDHWRGTGTILLVDDEETVRGIGSEMLAELGFDVVTATDGRDALAKFHEHGAISCVILDLTMPHMDGEQCFRELKQLDPQIKVIMSSGYNEQEVTEKFIGKGLAGFIQKPYTLSALKAVLAGEDD